LLHHIKRRWPKCECGANICLLCMNHETILAKRINWRHICFHWSSGRNFNLCSCQNIQFFYSGRKWVSVRETFESIFLQNIIFINEGLEPPYKFTVLRLGIEPQKFISLIHEASCFNSWDTFSSKHDNLFTYTFMFKGLTDD